VSHLNKTREPWQYSLLTIHSSSYSLQILTEKQYFCFFAQYLLSYSAQL
jgi:hypothetical protein